MKILLSLLALVLSVSTAFACGCGEPMSVLRTSDFADEIFMGRVISQGIVELKADEDWIKPWSKQSHGEMWYTLFEVEKKWKGGSSKRIKVYQESSCASRFERDRQPYIVYASYRDMIYDSTKTAERLYTWACIRNAGFQIYNYPSEYHWDDRDSLDLLFPNPVALSKITPQHEQIFWYLLVFVAGIGVGVVITRRRLSRAAVK